MKEKEIKQIDLKNKSCRTLIAENKDIDLSEIVARKVCNSITKKKYFSNEYNIEFEIVDGPYFDRTKLGTAGFEVYVKAWKDGKQIGFGADGSVEIERIRLFSPTAFMVEDNKGDITITNKIVGGKFDGMEITKKYREDILYVFTNDIAHTIKLVGKDNKNIKKGKIGKTVDTFNPLRIASQRSGTGYFAYNAGGGSFATWRGATSATYISTAGLDPDYCYIQMNKLGSNSYEWNVRAWGNFDTSSIPDSDTINSATISIKPDASVFNPPTDPLTGTQLNITAFSPADPRNVTNSDMDNFSDTKFATDYDWDSLSIGTYSDLTLNASGLSYINKTGDTCFFWRMNWDIDNTQPGATSGNTGASFTFGTGTNPQKLVVDHSSASSFNYKANTIAF